MNKARTPGLYSLHCACGLQVRVLDILDRTVTGRETVRHYCHRCGCISWWWRTPGEVEKVMLIDREGRPKDTKRWPPAGWMHRHCPPRRVR